MTADDADMTAANASPSINARAVVIGGAIIAGVLIALAVAVGIAIRHWNFRMEGPNAPLEIIPATPRLLSAPRADRAAFAIEKKKLIDNYRWDGHSATAAIPIDTAMRLSIERAQRDKQ